MKMRTPFLVVPLLCLLSPGTVRGQEVDPSLVEGMLLAAPPVVEVPVRGIWLAPSVSLGLPSGFGAGYGDAFVAAGYQQRTRTQDKDDGAVAAGFGVGDARSAVGVEFIVTSFGTVNTCCRGGISAKVHRVLLGNVGVAVGVENAVLWSAGAPAGEPATDAGRSFYTVATGLLRLRESVSDPFSVVTLSAGLGSGRFRWHDDIRADRDVVRPFASASVRVVPFAAVIADWSAKDLLAGLSIVPIPRVPLYIAPGLADLTTDPRFVLGVGFGFDYSSLF